MATCPKCGKYKSSKQEILDHIEKSHANELQDNQTPAQYYYTLHHGGRSYGLCRICGAPTKWNEKTGKPNQLCNNPACIAAAYKKASVNITNTHGEPHLAHREEHQAKMIANKGIAGVYKWTNDKSHAEKSYVGSYELKLLEFLDTVLELPNTEVVTPGPVLEYELDGVKKLWYTDVWLPEFNLIIEVKDGGNNKNNHPGFAENRRKEKAKDDMMKQQNKFNYLKHTDKNMAQLISMLSIIRFENLGNIKNENNRQSHVVINETATPETIANSLEFYLGRTSKGLIFYTFSPTLENICYVIGSQFIWSCTTALKQESIELFAYTGSKEVIEMLYSHYNNTKDYVIDINEHRVPITVYAEMLKMCDPTFTYDETLPPEEIMEYILNTCFVPSAFIEDASKYNYFEIANKLMRNRHEDVADVLMEAILLKHGIDTNESDIMLNESVCVRDAGLDFDIQMENIMTGINSLKEN